jgi:hypothetical protein
MGRPDLRFLVIAVGECVALDVALAAPAEGPAESRPS